MTDERAGQFVDDNLIYFRRRAAEERAAILASSDLRVRQTHLQLARRYEGAIRDILARRRIQRIRLLESV